MIVSTSCLYSLVFFAATGLCPVAALDYDIVDTAQVSFFNTGNELSGEDVPQGEEQTFFGQDAQYDGNQMAYVDNGDGTITDEVTGLMWTQSFYGRYTWVDAMDSVNTANIGGHDDWRIPTIKELYSLMDFRGTDISGSGSTSTSEAFIDTDFFEFSYGESPFREIDVQLISQTSYVAEDDPNTIAEFFGVNFADGRIKGYGKTQPRGDQYYVRYVRGKLSYGVNNLKNNGDATISDWATSLMWTQQDSASGMDWTTALDYCNDLLVGGYNDWRLPNAKELHSIVNYNHAPEATGSPAIDPIFDTTEIVNEAGELDWPHFWTSTTHEIAGPSEVNGANAVYIGFGKCMGYMNGNWLDVHGAGCQRSDPKEGDPGDYPTGHGPQGDAIRIYNHARCVRGGVAGLATSSPSQSSQTGTPEPTQPTQTQPSQFLPPPPPRPFNLRQNPISP